MSVSSDVMPQQQTTVAGSGTAIHAVISSVVGQTVTNSPTVTTAIMHSNVSTVASSVSSTTAQVRTLVKKKIMQIRTEQE